MMKNILLLVSLFISHTIFTQSAFFHQVDSIKVISNGNELKTDTDFVQSLLENSGIAVVQGSAFGLEGFFRISYATSMENLKKALEKISTFCKSLS